MKEPGASSERRIVTVLAADIVGSTQHIAACDPDDAQAFYDHWFEHVREVVERANGTLVSYAGDGGMAIFGWPNPLEDHADCACHAAWDLQCATTGRVGPDGTPVQFRVGLHSGLVALRQIRRGGRPRLDTIGATVNIAAKLEQRAPPGGVLVSAETVELCRTQLKLHAEDPTPELGAASTEAFILDACPEEVSDSDVSHRYSSPIFGREAELAALRKLLPRPGGESSSIALVGEAGIGKSRLAAAAVAEALGLDAKVLVFFGDAQKRTTPFAAARGLIGEALQISGSVSRESLRAALAGVALGEDEIGALEALLTSPQVRRDRAGKLTQTQFARALVHAFCMLALNRPTIVLVEDLHLIDPESQHFLQLLACADTAQPLCLLITSRPESLQEALETASSVLQLDPLGREAMEDLGRQLWPEGGTPGPMLARIVDRADGVPFVLEELVRSVDGTSAQHFQVLPHSVESLIHARLQRLSAGARTVAQALSLLGEDVDVALLAAVLQADVAILSDKLSELERFAFTHPVAGHATHLRHQIIAEACADTIPRQRRRQLHRTAVQAITSRYPDLSGRYERLAFHAEGADDAVAALDYLWEAGLEARRNSAAASLNLIFDRALALVERVGESAREKYVDFVLMACASMLQLGEFEKVNLHLPRVMDLVRSYKRPELVCSTLSQLGMICWFEGRYEEGLEATEEGLAIARGLKSPALIFSNQIMLSNLLHDMGLLERAIAEEEELCEMLTGKLETARLGAPAIPRTTALSFMGWFLMDTGAYAEGLDFAERGLEIAVREQDPYSEVLARSALGQALLMLNRNAEAADCLAVAHDLSERNGYDTIKADLAGRMAIALSRTGRAHEGVTIVEDCLRKKLHLRTGQLQVYHLYSGHAEALVGDGQVESGLERSSEALAIARRIKNPCLTVDALGLRARLLAQVAPGDPRIEEDLAEQLEVCKQYGIAAWPDVAPNCNGPLADPASARLGLADII